MKRPFSLIGFTSLLSLIVAIFFPITILYIFSIITVFFLLISLCFKKIRLSKTIPIVFLTTIFTFSIYSLNYNFKIKPLETLRNNDAFIKGTICELPYKTNDRYYYTLKTEKIEIEGLENPPQEVKLRLSTNKVFDADVYDKINCKVHLYSQTDELGFSSKSYYAAKGIHVFAYLYDFEDYTEEPGDSKPFYYYCLKAKETLCSSLRSVLLSDHADIANAILLGDQRGIDNETKSDFRDAGISHLLVVSGLHTAIIAELFTVLFYHLKFSKKYAELASCLGVLFFMCITCFPSTVVRAGIMIILFKLGKFFYLQSDSLNSLGFAALAVSIFNPNSGGDIGFLMSVCATLGIILLSPKINLFCRNFIKSKFTKCKHRIKNILFVFSSIISVTVSATLFTLPITMLYFKKISLVSIFANILVSTPATILIPTLLLVAVLNLIPILKFIVMPLSIFSEWIINFMLIVTKWLSSLPFASISTANSFLSFWLASTTILIVAFLVLKKKQSLRLLKTTFILSFIILFSGILSFQIFNHNITKLVVADTGDGCSLILKRDNQAAVLACGGDKTKYNKLISVLNILNVNKINFILLTDFDDATALYVQDLIDDYQTDFVLLPDRADIDDKLSRRISDNNKAKYFNEKAYIEPWDNVKITAINTDDQGFLFLNINDVKILVCPSRVNADYLPSEYQTCNFLIEGKIPENLDFIDSNYVIMANSSNVVNVNSKKIAQSDKIPISTAGMGHLCIDFLDKNKVSIRRLI